MLNADVIHYLESKYPIGLQSDWDNSGLHIGSRVAECARILVTLDVTPAVVDEAVADHVDLILSHHPLIFTPVTSLDITTPRGAMIAKLLRHNITLYTLHSNYDAASGGMNDVLAKLLGLTELRVLDIASGVGRIGKIPAQPGREYVEFVKKALNVANVRFIGDMSGTVLTVAVCGGSGSDFIPVALASGCDLYITGDVTYHDALESLQSGLKILDVGHYAESVFKLALQRELSAQFPRLIIRESVVNSDPYQLI